MSKNLILGITAVFFSTVSTTSWYLAGLLREDVSSSSLVFAVVGILSQYILICSTIVWSRQ